MTQSLKQRLVGALVLLAIAILLIPALFDQQAPESELNVEIPPAPALPEVPVFVDRTGPEAEPLPDLAVLAEGQADVTDARQQTKVLDEAPLTTDPAKEQLDQAQAPVAWTLQVGTFGNQANAARLVNDLQQQGFHAYQRDFRQKEGKRLSRVYVGPLVSRPELEQIAAELEESRKLKGLILRYHP